MNSMCGGEIRDMIEAVDANRVIMVREARRVRNNYDREMGLRLKRCVYYKHTIPGACRHGQDCLLMVLSFEVSRCMAIQS